MKYLTLVILFALFPIVMYGQHGADTTTSPPPDSIKNVLQPDSLQKIILNDSTIHQIAPPTPPPIDHIIAADSITHANTNGIIIPDSLDVIRHKTDSIILNAPNEKTIIPEIKEPFSPDPKKAVIYSAIFPGLGQIYNRKYWKLPILYGGFIGLTYAISWNGSHYRDYFGAYIDIMDEDPNTNRWEKFVPYGQTPESIDKTWLTKVLKDRKDYFRYYRDFSIIGAVAVYGLAIVDAYVDAQLFDFDVSPDLSMRLEPSAVGASSTGFRHNVYGLKWSINF